MDIVHFNEELLEQNSFFSYELDAQNRLIFWTIFETQKKT